PHVGSFSRMVSDFHHEGFWKGRLAGSFAVLFSDPGILQSCRDAAQHASEACAKGVVAKVWRHLELFALRQAFGEEPNHA
ncbi:hypothetical protein L7F22_057080, partial [Adiantum nelumboides]|nr:hypothetical protein [Adiantum nelumboides]